MPVRKSTASAVSTDDAVATKSATPDDGLSIEDLNLPKSIVQRLAKGVLPPNTQIQKDALLAMSKSATVFVNYLTSAAAENAQRSGKKTIMPKDVFEAMVELEFAAMLPRLEAEVNKFTSIQADKRNTYRKKVREEKKKTTVGEPGPEPKGEAEADGSPRVKRVRRESGDEGTGTEGEGDENENEANVEEQEQEDDEVEDDEAEEEVQEEGLTEDLLEEKQHVVEDDEMADGDESD